jgi:hypothetical protein
MNVPLCTLIEFHGAATPTLLTVATINNNITDKRWLVAGSMHKMKFTSSAASAACFTDINGTVLLIRTR